MDINRTFWIPKKGVYMDVSGEFIILHNATIKKQDDTVFTELSIQIADDKFMMLKLNIFRSRPDNFWTYLSEL